MKELTTKALGPQYNLQGGNFFESLITGKRLWRSHWTPVNMTEDVIERNNTVNTKDCLEDLIFGDFNDQPIPSTYSDITNDYDKYRTQIDAELKDHKGVEDAFVPNDENNDDDSLASDIDPTPKNIPGIEGLARMGNETEEREIEGADLDNEVVEN